MPNLVLASIIVTILATYLSIAALRGYFPFPTPPAVSVSLVAPDGSPFLHVLSPTPKDIWTGTTSPVAATSHVEPTTLPAPTPTPTGSAVPAVETTKGQSLTTDSNLNGLPDVGDVVTYSYRVTNTGDVMLSDDVEGVLTLSDVAGDGVGVLAVGASETASSAHTVTQARFDAGTLTNIATANGTSPLGVGVQDTDTQTLTFAQNPANQVVKSQALTTDTNLNGLI